MILAFGFCMGFFQNCSKISPQDLANVEVSNKSQSVATAEPQATEPQALQNGHLADRETSVTLTTDDAKEIQPVDAKSPDKDEKQPHACANKEIAKVDVSEETEAIAECLHLDRKELLQTTVYKNMHGSYEISADQIDEISDSRGKLIVHAKKASGHINKISNYHGKIILCNMNVDVVDGVHGKMILVNSKIKSLTNQHGTIKSFNSIIETTDQKFTATKNP